MELLKLLASNRTAWNLREISLILGKTSEETRFKVFRWCQKGYLRRLRKGVYVRTDKKYNPLEVAGLIFKPSYVSFETALFLHGAITQGTWSVVTIASYLTREIEVDGWILKALRVKKDILYTPKGLIPPEKCKFGYVTFASPERALLDTLYFYKSPIEVQFKKVFDKKRLDKLLKVYFKSENTRKKYQKIIKEVLDEENENAF